MKRIITLLTILAFFSFSPVMKAQLTSHGVTTYASGGDIGAALETQAIIVNTSENSVNVKVIRTNTSLAAGHESYFCIDGFCYQPITSTVTFTLASTDSANFQAYADPKGSYGTDHVHYLIYNLADSANDNISFDFTYDFATAVHDLSPANSYLFCSQSNTEGMTSVTYGITNLKNAKLVVRNLLGSVVREVALNDKQGVLNVSTAEFPSGIYMYFLYNNDQPVATRKMVISRR